MNNLTLTCVSKHFSNGNNITQVLQNVSLTIEAGESLAIVGPSGSGKSTLLNIIGLLETPSEGVYFLEGASVQEISSQQRAQLRNRYFGFIFQAFHLVEYLSALENVSLPLMYMGMRAQARRERAHALLSRVGLAHRIHHPPSTLSGGERQRVAIARALINNPKVLLADELTGNLDTHTAQQVMSLLLQLQRRAKFSIIMVTHNVDLARTADRVLHMQHGALCAL